MSRPQSNFLSWIIGVRRSAKSSYDLIFAGSCLLIVAALSTTLGCSSHQGSSGGDGIIRRGLSGEAATLDPSTAADTFSEEILRDLYEGLTSEAADGSIVPGVAASWSVDSSGTTYTFNIRPDARWSTGEPVTARQFVSSWRRVVDPRQASPNADLFRPIEGAIDIIEGHAPVTNLGVTTPGDRVLVVKLMQPAPYFPALLAHAAAYPIYSDAAAHTHDPRRWVSNGAFILGGWHPGTDIRLARNPKYWDSSHVGLAGVDYEFTPDENAQLRRYRAGELDLTDIVPANSVSTLRQERPAELRIAPFLATAYYGLNLTDEPLRSKKKLRQALAMAIDRHKIVTELGGGQVAAYGFVPLGTANYTTQSWDWQTLSDGDRIARARQLYAEAGYSLHEPLVLRLIYGSNPGIRNTAIIIAAMWKAALGVETRLEDQEFKVFLETRHDHSRWDIARLSWAADYDDAGTFLDTLRTASPNNDEIYSSAGYDAALDKAARTAGRTQREALLESGERVMLADYPIIPLYFFVSRRLVKPYVTGATENPLNHVASKYLGLVSH